MVVKFIKIIVKTNAAPKDQPHVQHKQRHKQQALHAGGRGTERHRKTSVHVGSVPIQWGVHFLPGLRHQPHGGGKFRFQCIDETIAAAENNGTVEQWNSGVVRLESMCMRLQQRVDCASIDTCLHVSTRIYTYLHV